jgi:hypothetical protein
MPLFGLGDITFNKNPFPTKGPLADLAESPYKTRTLRYPSTIGSAGEGHYMMIYINKQKTSQLLDSPEENATSQATSALLNKNNNVNISSAIKNSIGGQAGSVIANQIGKVDNFTGGILSDVTAGVKSVIGGLGSNRSNILNGNAAATQSIINRNIKSLQSNGGKLSQTKFTGDVIALYMPDTLQFEYKQNYDELSLTRDLVGLVGVAAAEQIENNGDKQKFLDAVKAVVARTGAGFGDIGRAGAFLGFGAVVNPMLEVIYNSPSFRSFDYVFKFYPRNEREAVEVQKIINILKYHQAPEVKTDGSISMLIPPSEFDIKFYYSGKENDNIPKIGSCVLRNIQVNYAPNGWTAYEVPGQDATLGGTGMPVGIEMTLSFQEVTYLTKNVPNEFAQRAGVDFTKKDTYG